MADDVASFFKIKKSKKHGGQVAAVQTPDELARRLERTVQQQQLIDRENGVEKVEEEERGPQNPPYSKQISTGDDTAGAVAPVGQNKEEDSEWLEVLDQTDIDLEKLGIKEMELTEEGDLESSADDESLTSRKTWNIPGQNQSDKQTQKAAKITYAAGMDVDDAEEASVDATANIASKEEEKSSIKEEAEKEKEAEPEESTEKKPKAYIPPSMRGQQLAAASRTGGKKPNISDVMEFPSLDAAIKLEEELEKSKKKKPLPPQSTKKAWSQIPAQAPPPASAWAISAPAAPASAWSAKAQLAPSPTPPDRRSPRAESPAAPPASEKPNPNKYVPPHLRK